MKNENIKEKRKIINKTKEEGIKLPNINRTKTSQEVKEEVKLSNEFAFSIFESRKSKKEEEKVKENKNNQMSDDSMYKNEKVKFEESENITEAIQKYKKANEFYTPLLLRTFYR